MSRRKIIFIIGMIISAGCFFGTFIIPKHFATRTPEPTLKYSAGQHVILVNAGKSYMAFKQKIGNSYGIITGHRMIDGQVYYDVHFPFGSTCVTLFCKETDIAPPQIASPIEIQFNGKPVAY